MRFKIHFTVIGNTDTVDPEYHDSFIVEGENAEEIREKADAELAKRGGYHPWSEEIPS